MGTDRGQGLAYQIGNYYLLLFHFGFVLLFFNEDTFQDKKDRTVAWLSA